MSIRAPQGTLNIPNAILRVGKLELDDATGFDTALNTIARNTILLEDLGPYDSGNKQWGLKVPNIFVATFEIQGVSAFNFMNTVNGDANTGYTLEFSGTTLTLKYDGVNLTTATIPNLDSTYGKVYLTYEKQYFTVTIDGTRVLEYKDTTTRTPPTNGEYINFFAGESGSPRFKNLKIVNGNWITDGTSNISYVGGNVSLSEGLDVSGNVEVGTANLFVDTTTGKVTMNETKISSNLEVGTSNLFVDTLTGRVGIGKTDPGAALDVVGEAKVSSNLVAANSKFSLDTNGTFKQNANENGRYIKLTKYFANASNWKIATGSYLGSSYQWLSIRAKMARLDVDVETIQFNYYGHGGISRVRDPIVIGGGGSATQANEIKVYNKTADSTYEIYLQIDSATSVEVEITHRGSTIDDDYSTVAAGAINETGLTKIYDSGTTTDLRLKSGRIGIGTTNPGTAKLRIDLDTITSDSQHLIMHAKYENANDGYLEFLETNHTPAQNDWLGWGTRIQKVVDVTRQGYIEFNPVGDGYDIAFGNDGGGGSGEIMRIDGVNGRVGIGTTNPKAPLHVNYDKAIINQQMSLQTFNVYKTAGGNTGSQTRRYYRVYVPNSYANFQIIFQGFARNYFGNGDIQDWRRQYTVQRNVGSGITISHDSGEDINASGFTFATSQTGGVTGVIEVHFDVTFPPKPEYATYITFTAQVIGDTGYFAENTSV